jgi:hypothetical protein
MPAVAGKLQSVGQPIAEKALGFRLTGRMLRNTASTVMHEQGVAVKAAGAARAHPRRDHDEALHQLTDPSADHAARVMSQAWTAALADVEKKLGPKRRHRKTISRSLAGPKARAASA